MLSRATSRRRLAGDHGTTYGGNLLACRAALVFLDALDGGLLTSIRRSSNHLFVGLQELQRRYPSLIADVRGAGLIAGLDLTRDATPVVAAALIEGCWSTGPPTP